MKRNQATRESYDDGAEDSQMRTAAYIADLVGQMEVLARKENIDRLERLLSEARQEALRLTLKQ